MATETTAGRAASRPDEHGFIHPSGTRIGGHALLVVGVRIRPVGTANPDPEASSFVVQNSWGPDWGDGGRARMTFAAMESLLDRAEVCIPLLRTRASRQVPPPTVR